MDIDLPKVFISYSSSNEDFAELVKLKLEKENIIVWKDTNQISVGVEWRNEIDNGILSSDLIIIIMDKYSASSSYVTYEWAFALGNGKRVIPVLTEECEIHPRISVLQYFDFKNNRPWDELIKLILSHQISPKNTIRVSDLTIYELEKILASTKLANKLEDSDFKANDVASVVNQLAIAKKHLNASAEVINTILWVDDRPNNNTYERRAFETIGFRFDLAKSTREGLDFFSSNKYIAIISDMGRKEGPQEGYMLLREIRKIDKQIPFFIYAGSNSIEHKVEAQEKGAQGSTNRVDKLIELVTAHIWVRK